jgi:hypothetical protein
MNPDPTVPNQPSNPVDPLTAPQAAQPTASQPEPQIIRPSVERQPMTQPIARTAMQGEATSQSFQAPQPVQSATVTPPTGPVVGNFDPLPGQPTVTTGGPPSHDMLPSKPKHANKKRLLMVGAPLLFAVLVAGGVFGLYLPSTPGAVFSTGLGRTGKALDKLVATAVDEKRLATYKSSQVTGDFKLTGDFGNASGKINSQFDDNNSDNAFNMSYRAAADPAEKKLDVKVLTETPKDKSYPNIYFNVSGLATLGADQFLDVSQIENKWIVVSSDYLSSLTTMAAGGDQSKQDKLSAADVAELSQTAVKVSREYVFSTDKDKAVLENKKFVGKETVDGMKTYHYKVEIREAGAIAYCKALTSAEISTNAYKKLTGASNEELNKQKTDAAKYCDSTDFKDGLKELKGEQDLWVDAKYKLVHKIRFHNPENTKEYIEIGQRYTGGDEITLFMNGVFPDNGDFQSSMTSNLKSNKTSFKLTGKTTAEGAKGNLIINIAVTPSDDDVNMTAPTDAISIEQLMEQLQSNSQSPFANDPALSSELSQFESDPSFANDFQIN